MSVDGGDDNGSSKYSHKIRSNQYPRAILDGVADQQLSEDKLFFTFTTGIKLN